MPAHLKDPSVRARRNKTSTAAKLSVVEGGNNEAPGMPELYRVVDDRRLPQEYHPMAIEFWDDVWSSPMANEFLDADLHGLYVVLTLTDSYWKRLESGRPVTGLAMELRLQRQSYGLTPIDRRRLQWEVDKGDEASDRTRKRRATSAVPQPGEGDAGDARDALT